MKLFCSDDDNDGDDSSGDNDHDDSNNGNEDKDNEDNINEDLDHDIQQLGPHEQFLKEHQFPPPPPPPFLCMMICSTCGIVVLVLTRTWAKQKGHAPCTTTLIQFEQDCCWILGRLVNWKHVPPSHCAKWCLPFHQSSLPPPPTTRCPATNASHICFVGVSRMSLLTSPVASTAIVRSARSAPIYSSSRSQASTVSSHRKICCPTGSRGCIRFH